MKCVICEKDNITNLGAHVRQAHDMSMDEYAEYDSKDTELTNEIEEDKIVKEIKIEKEDNSDIISEKERRARIFSVETKDPNRPLSEVLYELDITEKELYGIIRQVKTGSPMAPSEMMKTKSKIAKTKADKFKDKDKVEVTDIYIAESLTKDYGFTVTEVKSPQNGKPKTWVLKK